MTASDTQSETPAELTGDHLRVYRSGNKYFCINLGHEDPLKRQWDAVLFLAAAAPARIAIDVSPVDDSTQMTEGIVISNHDAISAGIELIGHGLRGDRDAHDRVIASLRLLLNTYSGE